MKHLSGIFIVEDEALIAMMLKLELQNAGYPVCGHESTGEKTVSFVRTENPDLILMDIQLAGNMDGITAALEIRKFSDVPIIFMTCYDNDDYKRKAAVVTPWDYLIKPVSINDITAVINSHLK